MRRFFLIHFLGVGVIFAQRPPAIPIDGYHLVCDSGNLVSTASGKPSIGDLGNSLGTAILKLNVPQVDLVSHSVGGLIVWSYVAGKQNATPNFGALIPGILSDFLPDVQARELTPASHFLFDLNTWNQNRDDLRGVDAVGIVGNAGGIGPLQGTNDGTVAVTSASLSFAEADERTRVLPYCHGAGDLTMILGLGCNGPPLAATASDNPLSWQIVDSFLAGTSDWTSVGHTPSQDKILSQYGGVLTQARNILSLAPRMLISIYGNSLAGSTVMVNGQTLALNYTSDTNAQGLQTLNIFVEAAVPATFTLDGSGTGAAGVSGVPVTVTYAGLAPGFPGLDQINFQLPAGVTSGTVVVVVGNHASNPVAV